MSDTTLAISTPAASCRSTLARSQRSPILTVVAFVGGIACAWCWTSGGGGTTAGGAFGLNQITTDTEAFIADHLTGAGNGLTIVSHAADVAGADEISIAATRGGIVVSLSAAISANTNTGDAKAFAGSVSINRLVDKTNALIDGADVSNVQNSVDARIKAINEADVIAIGGGGAGTTGTKGVGGSLASTIGRPVRAG